MSRLKQRTRAFRTAEKEFNRKKVALDREFTSEMHKACKSEDMQYFNALKEDYRKYFGEPGEFTIIGIELMYGIES